MNRILDRHTKFSSRYGWAIPKTTTAGFRSFLKSNASQSGIATRVETRSEPAQATEVSNSAHRKMFTGNFFAGPVAMANPGLFGA